MNKTLTQTLDLNKATNQVDETFCIVCTKKFKTSKSFKAHLKKYHGEGKIHECILCDTSFTVFDDLITHIQEHRRQMKLYFSCKLCDAVFEDGKSLESHVVDHIGPEIIRNCKKNLHDCSECGAAFPSLIDLCNHRKEKHFDQKYHCGQCEESFSRSEDLHLHTRLHRGLGLLKCLCGKMFASPRNLASHLSKLHPGMVDESVLVMLSEGLPVDFKNVQDWKELQSNPNTEQPSLKILERKFKCPIPTCSLAFVKVTTLVVHCNRNHPEQFQPSQLKNLQESSLPDLALIRSQEKPIIQETSCNICSTTFNSHYSLLQHLTNEHDATRPFKCANCKLYFSKVRTLEDHINLIHESDKFRCDYCGIQFQKQASLTAHYKKHEGNETFICDMCHVPYTSRKQLVKHMRIHIDGVHKCSFCDKVFIQSCDLVKHERIHSGMKPFSCTTCLKSFSQACVLKQHEVIHTGAREFVCIECGKAFQNKSNLTVHMRIHKGNSVTCFVKTIAYSQYLS